MMLLALEYGGNRGPGDQEPPPPFCLIIFIIQCRIMRKDERKCSKMENIDAAFHLSGC